MEVLNIRFFPKNKCLLKLLSNSYIQYAIAKYYHVGLEIVMIGILASDFELVIDISLDKKPEITIKSDSDTFVEGLFV